MPKQIKLSDIQPPSDVSVEQQVLGCCIIEPGRITEVASVVNATDFYDDLNRIVFATLSTMAEAGLPIDATLLVAELKRTGEYELVGSSYLAKLVKSVATASYATYYATIVAEKSRQRKIIDAATRAIQDALSGEPAGDIAAKLQSSTEAALLSGCEQSSISVSQAAQAIVGRIQTPNSRFGLSTGFPSLDEVSGGLQPGQMTVLGALSSIGKSAFALELAYRAALAGKRSLIVSLEMTAEDITFRLIQRLSGIPVVRIQSGDLDSNEKQRIGRIADEIASLPIEIVDSPDMTVSQIRAIAKLHKARHGLDLLVVDYLQLVSEPAGKSFYEKTTAISKKLRAVPSQLGVPLLALAQLNREAAQKTKDGKFSIPDLHHLRESGSIEQDAHNVWFLHRDTRDSTEAKIAIRKQRQGPIGILDFRFDPDRMKFCDSIVAEEWQA